MPAKKTTKPRRTPVDQISEPLQRLVKLLQKGGGTARALMTRMKCSKPTIYARITALREHAFKLKEERVRDGSKGPLAVSYSL